MSDRAGEEGASSFNQSLTINQIEVDGSIYCDAVGCPINVFFIIVYSLVFLVGLPLNIFIIKFYFCRAQPKESRSIMVYLKNLAAADFLLCLSLPIRIMNFSSTYDTIRMVNCYFGSTFLFLNMYASIMFMGYIAANRYQKVVKPLRTHILQTVRAAHILCTVTWVILLGATSAFAILTIHTLPPFTSAAVYCEIFHSAELVFLHKIIQSFSMAIFLFVFVSLVFFYYSTIRRVLQAQQRQPASTKLAKARRNMLVLVSVFCFCFVPFHVVFLPISFRGIIVQGAKFSSS